MAHPFSLAHATQLAQRRTDSDILRTICVQKDMKTSTPDTSVVNNRLKGQHTAPENAPLFIICRRNQSKVNHFKQSLVNDIARKLHVRSVQIYLRSLQNVAAVP